jgi:hypothetical protein
MSKDVQI